ncbi:MAG: hypothetical protein JW846_06825 [Dehalococcoidia bacterium]|nr:hypothetical protein [Dehalococcoidia bacterium]
MEITIVNLFLATAVVLLGIRAWARSRSEAALFVSIAFGLFALAHLLTLLGLAGTLGSILIALRILGYLSAALAVYRIGAQS